MTKGDKSITAEELLSQLEGDSAYRALREKLDREHEALILQRAIEEAALVLDLNKAGLNVRSVWDLANMPNAYDTAMPILLKNLEEPHPDWVLEGIARALAIPSADLHWTLLVRKYKAVNEAELPRFKQGLAVALTAIAEKRKRYLKDILELIQDRRHGSTRSLFFIVLKKWKTPESISMLELLANDPQLGRHVRGQRRGVERDQRTVQ